MVSSFSKWKNVFGEKEKNASFENITPRLTSTSEGYMIDVSSELIAANWHTSGGGAVGIFQTTNYIRLNKNFPLIYGHKGPVTDIKFSPMNPLLLATSSEDGTVKLWNIPQEGLKEDLREESQAFSNHSKRAMILNWNPTVYEIIASAGNDNDLYVWNITNSEVISKIKLDDPSVYSLEWNYNGTILGSMLKNRYMHLFDVRNNKSIMSCEGHNSGKIQKMYFADNTYVYSAGFSNQGYRELKLYDTRDFTKSIQNYKLDSLQGMLTSYYDTDTGLAFLYAKGESLISYVEIKEGSIKPASTYSSNEQAIGLSFFPKRTMDYNKSELARTAKMTKDSIHYVSFKYPRRNEGFNEEFYPKCYSGKASMTLEEWSKGEEKAPITDKINEIENKFKTEPVIFEKKEVVENKPVTMDSLLKENESLKKRIAELEEENKKLKANK